MPRKTRKQKIQAENRNQRHGSALYTFTQTQVQSPLPKSTQFTAINQNYFTRDIKKTLLLGISFISIEILIRLIFSTKL